MDKKRIYFADLTHESQLGIGSDTMPLQLGLIAAWLLKEMGDEVEVEIFKYTEEFAEAVLERPPFLLACSNYLWNLDLGYRYVEAIRRRFPEVITVFGGPNYPDEREDQEEFLRQYPEIDFYIYKDGEAPFAKLVRFLLDNPGLAAAKTAELPSCHTLHEGQAYFGETEPRLRDLTTVPSPYVMGLMDKFFEHTLIPTIQTNRGCPFTCTFCTEGGHYYNKVFKSSFDRKKADVDYILDHLKQTRTLRVTDSNFGMFEEDVEFCRYLSDIQERTGYPEYVMCSTGKNRKERVLECNRLLRGAMRLTASVQSLSPAVLEAVKRKNISLDGLMFFSDETSDTDAHAYSEVILGLPGDSVAAMEESISGLMDVGIGNITQHQLALIHGTEMNSRQTREDFTLRGMFRPIQRCVGRYRFGDEEFVAVEIEEICVSSNSLSVDDYLEMRRLYLTVGIFYNDRIFGEIHSLLRTLDLPSWAWISMLHRNIPNMDPEVRALFDDYARDTMGELWDTREDLVRDVSADVDRYDRGECGGNLIYKYRSRSIVECFEKVHAEAFRYLREYLAGTGSDCVEAVAELERFSRLQKFSLFDLDRSVEETFSYDIPRLLYDPRFAREGGRLDDLHRPTRVDIRHTDKQRATIERELGFYGDDIPGMTMMISRYPVKRFWRKAETVPESTAA